MNEAEHLRVESPDDLADLTAMMPRRRLVEEAEMDITPMIDITFLLLIFFLVASKLDTQADVALPPARHGTAASTQASVILTIAQGDGEQALVYKGDGTREADLVQATDLADQENEIAAYVRQGLNVTPPKKNVIIKAEKGIQHREVSRVAQAVGSVEEVHSGGIQLHIAVLEAQ